MMISVIIPTYNRSDRLKQLLSSLAGQVFPSSTPDFEILVIDNGSAVDTAAVAAGFAKTLPMLRHLSTPEPGLHVGRHLGMKEGRGEILAYLDDDVDVFPTWLASLGECFSRPRVALAGGKNLPRFEGVAPVWLIRMWDDKKGPERVLSYLSLLDLGDDEKIISPYRVFGCNFAIRRECLAAAGGFHPDSMPEHLLRFRGDGEDHVARYVENRSGGCAYYHPGASVYHAVPAERMTAEYFRRRAFRHGISDSYRHFRAVGQCRRRDEWLAYFRYIFSAMIHLAQNGFDDMGKIAGATMRGYWQGYRFHRRELRADPELRAWVRRENYL